MQAIEYSECTRGIGFALIKNLVSIKDKLMQQVEIIQNFADQISKQVNRSSSWGGGFGLYALAK